ncbi:MAG: DUF3883 domain-containing protein [Thermoplasmata archaeon]|nr:DUF3883 domain-containing protein [Thermoplasmata archaeon]
MFISDEYLKYSNLSSDQWVRFFTAIGVNDKLGIDINEKQYTQSTLEKMMDIKGLEPPRASDYEGIPGYKYLIIDPDFDESIRDRITQIATLAKIERNDIVRAFWRILDANWSEYYSKYTNVKGRFVEYASKRISHVEDQINTPLTDFANLLYNTPLIIAENSDELRLSKEVLKFTDETRLLAEQGVPVCSIVFTDNNLVEWLDFNETTQEISPIEHLRLLKKNERMTTSIFIDKAIEISKWIEQRKLNVKEVRNAFEQDKLIIDNNNRFWKLSDVFYESPFSVYYPNFKELYPNLKDFFCDDLGCPEKEPRIDQFLNLFLDYLWPKKGQYTLNDNVRSDIVKCYRRINNYLEEHGQSDLPETFKKYQEHCRVYCLKESDWISPNDNIIIYCDNPIYRENFIAHGISLASHIEHMKKDVDAIAPLLKFLNVISASKLESRVDIIDVRPYSVRFDAHSEPLIIENLSFYCQAIETILSHFEREESSNAVKQTLVDTIARMRHFSSMRKSLQATRKINLDLFTKDGEKLISDKKDVHFSVKKEFLDICLTGQLVMVYGPFADELIAHLDFSNLPNSIEKILKSLTRDTAALLSDNKYREAVGRYICQYRDEDSISEEEELNIEDEDDDEIEVTIGNPDDEANTGLDEEGGEDEDATTYDTISKPVDLNQVTVEVPNIDEATPPPSKEPRKKCKKHTHRGHISTMWSDEDGQKGEKVVYDKEVEKVAALTAKMELNSEDYLVVWISKNIPENPWDIESWMLNKEGSGLVPVRIEVKSSSGSGYTFPMSIGEFDTALEAEHKKGRYYVYRVFNVRESNPSIKIFDFELCYSRKLISFEGKDFYITLPQI